MEVEIDDTEDQIEVEINSTKTQIEDFIESFLWEDIKRELLEWNRQFDVERDSIVSNAEEANPSTASVLMHLGDLYGRKQAVNYFLRLPKVFLGILEGKENDSGRDSTN